LNAAQNDEVTAHFVMMFIFSSFYSF